MIGSPLPVVLPLLGLLVGSLSGFIGMVIAKKMNLQKGYEKWIVVLLVSYVIFLAVFYFLFPDLLSPDPFTAVFMAAIWTMISLFPLILGALAADKIVGTVPPQKRTKGATDAN